MDDQARPDQPAGLPKGGPAQPVPPPPPGPLPPARPGSAYKARRMGWIREHSSDDRFLVFVGVLVTVSLLGAVGYKLLKELRRQPALEPVPLTALYNAAQAEELSPGVIRASYDFATDPKIPELRESCPQLADWEVPKGTVASIGVLVSGQYSRYRPYFTPGDLAVECDAALIYGSQIALRLSSIEEGQEALGYWFELWAPRGPEEPATARIVQYRDEMIQVCASPTAKLPELRARRDPPRFYHLKFELADGTLRGSFQGQQVCQMPVGEVLPGAVTLLGLDSQTAFDNVVITGRAHPDFIRRRTSLYRLFQAPKQPPAEPKRWWQF